MKIYLVYFLSTLVLYFCSCGFTFGSDIEKVEVTVDKITDFSYESVIIVTFRDKGFLIKENEQLYNPENYFIYPKTSFQMKNLLKFIRPDRVTRSETIPEIYIYVSLQPKTEYVLKIEENTIAYEDNEFAKTHLVDGIKLDEKYYKFIKSAPVFDIDIVPSYGINDLIFDTKVYKPWSIENKTLFAISIDGVFSLERETSFNSIVALLELKHNLLKEGYMPLSFYSKLETSQDFTNRNIVGGVEIELLIPIPVWLKFSSTQFSPFPIAKCGYEYARSIESSNNMNRVSGSFVWKIPVGDKLIVDNRINVIYDLNNTDKLLSFREHSLVYRITKDFKIICLKIIEGKRPPLFEYQRNISTGISLDFFSILGRR